ncbi:MAG: hotdog fold thioesterase [Flavobacteriia bacterium]|jgi:1,4-dihydroxy-2-naphthoyl-CoA hydrolase
MNWNTRDLTQINAFCKNTMMEHLNISFVAITDDSIVAKMPVNSSVHQPMGLLHGGANVVLIESVGSMASALLCNLKKEAPVGIEVNANHISSVKTGFVLAVGKAIHLGKSTHVWQVDIYEEETKKHLSTGRLTVLIKQMTA